MKNVPIFNKETRAVFNLEKVYTKNSITYYDYVVFVPLKIVNMKQIDKKIKEIETDKFKELL